jgi:hypothetical protein
MEQGAAAAGLIAGWPSSLPLGSFEFDMEKEYFFRQEASFGRISSSFLREGGGGGGFFFVQWGEPGRVSPCAEEARRSVWSACGGGGPLPPVGASPFFSREVHTHVPACLIVLFSSSCRSGALLFSRSLPVGASPCFLGVCTSSCA